MVDDEGLEEIGNNGLLKGLSSLLPSSVGETVSAVGVHEDTAFATASEGAPKSGDGKQMP